MREAVDPDCPMLLVEETSTGPGHPFSGEKLSVVLAIYRYDGGIAAAADLVNAITSYQGLGHTCGIHTSSDANVEQLAMALEGSRPLGPGLAARPWRLAGWLARNSSGSR